MLRGGRCFVTAAITLVIVVACGDADDAPAAAPPAPTSSVLGSAATTAVTTLPRSVYEGVTVAQSQADTPPHEWWWVIDLSDAASIDGSGRVLVEIPQDEVGCGDAMRPIDTFQLRDGATVTFELIDDAPDAPPAYWFTENASFDFEPAVRGRQFRVDCPPGTEEVAADLAAQRAHWEQAGIDTYEFTMSYYVFSGLYGDYRINVVDGETVRLVREDGSELDAMLAEELPSTIDELFDRLERSVTADSFVAEFDSELGYPRSVLVDHMMNAVDDELEVRVTSLTPAAG
jgi:hypothetical protein